VKWYENFNCIFLTKKLDIFLFLKSKESVKPDFFLQVHKENLTIRILSSDGGKWIQTEGVEGTSFWMYIIVNQFFDCISISRADLPAE